MVVRLRQKGHVKAEPCESLGRQFPVPGRTAGSTGLQLSDSESP